MSVYSLSNLFLEGKQPSQKDKWYHSIKEIRNQKAEYYFWPAISFKQKKLQLQCLTCAPGYWIEFYAGAVSEMLLVWLATGETVMCDLEIMCRKLKVLKEWSINWGCAYVNCSITRLLIHILTDVGSLGGFQQNFPPPTFVQRLEERLCSCLDPIYIFPDDICPVAVSSLILLCNKL